VRVPHINFVGLLFYTAPLSRDLRHGVVARVSGDFQSRFFWFQGLTKDGFWLGVRKSRGLQIRAKSLLCVDVLEQEKSIGINFLFFLFFSGHIAELWPGLTRFGAGGPVCPWVFDDFVRICSEFPKSMKDPRADWPSRSKSSTSGRFCF